MKAAMLAIGDELLNGNVTDTNSNVVASMLSVKGFTLERKTTVRDRTEDILSALKDFDGSVDLVVVTGGLGPTVDDLTRESVAEFLGRKLVRDERILALLKRRFEKLGFPFAEGNARQADVIEGAEVLPNPKGTAPGFFIHRGDGKASIVAFPGVPFEFEPMFEKFTADIGKYFPDAKTAARVVLKTTGVPESLLDDWVVKSGLEGVRFGTVCQLGETTLRFESDGSLDELTSTVEAILEKNPALRRKTVSRCEIDTTATAVLEKLRGRGLKLAVAESCTGGLISKLLTDVPGSSESFIGGAVVYSNELKVNILGVKPATLKDFGAVSYETAREMAKGLLDAKLPVGALKPDLALSVTGIAGPGGGIAKEGIQGNDGTIDKPVGTVFIGVAGLGGEAVYQFRFHGDRNSVRNRTAFKALELLWDWLSYGEIAADLLYSLVDYKIYPGE